MVATWPRWSIIPLKWARSCCVWQNLAGFGPPGWLLPPPPPPQRIFACVSFVLFLRPEEMRICRNQLSPLLNILPIVLGLLFWYYFMTIISPQRIFSGLLTSSRQKVSKMCSGVEFSKMLSLSFDLSQILSQSHCADWWLQSKLKNIFEEPQPRSFDTAPVFSGD